MDLLGLPVVMIENIFSYLSYDEIAKNRLVSRAFNEISMRMLNRGFMMIERRHAMALKNVKAQLPRRESERRYHHLSRHCDILTSIETRISMLNMTYSKFIDNGLCCFIPGKVIDEIRRVLTIVETSTTPPRAHEVLQELRDISSMAIEQFDDKIAPAFRKRLQQGVVQPTPRPSHAVLAPLAIRQEMVHLRQRSILNAKFSIYLASQYKKFHKQMMEYKKIAWRQQKTIRDLTKRQREQDNAIADLKKRIEECDIKYSELTHTNQAVGGKAIAVLPNMKPRKPLIKLPSLSEDDSEPPPKLPKMDESRFNPTPSTSMDKQSPKTKSQTTIAKIRGIANEIRYLTNLPKAYEAKLKRPLTLTSELNVPETKKQKLD
ncbi:F-box only protein 28 isoform X3 [Spodoptera litura]|uniref:F-box only protein 28 isoform X3 n=1 Tax=Spodoptera litura TaxID=69820 RepID=A0A9J7EDG6_SPOLT|nr:F-box only protein 28 isoform X3 [Spodoptera litura]